MENKHVVSHHRDMELVKTAMLRHEETFRQQVAELHRLYRVQKQLMGGGSELRLSCRRQIIRRRRRRQPRRALDPRLHLSAVITPPPSATEDGLELTLAIGSGGRCRRKRRRDETAGGSQSSDISGGGGGGGLTMATSSSSTVTGGSPLHERAMPAFHRLQEQETTATTAAKQPPRWPWLVQCVSLEMA